MESQVATGRRLVLAVIVASLMISILVIVVFNISRGPERLPQQIVRFLGTIALCVFLYRGANWARWVVSILSILAGFGALLLGLDALSSSGMGFLLIAMGLVYVVSAGILLFVPTVRAYFSVEKTDADALSLEKWQINFDDRNQDTT